MDVTTPSVTTVGSTVTYSCKAGYSNTGESGVSTCEANGQWSTPTLICIGKSTISSIVIL